MRKIIRVFDENKADKYSSNIYVNVEVDYGNGITGSATMTRAKVEGLFYKKI